MPQLPEFLRETTGRGLDDGPCRSLARFYDGAGPVMNTYGLENSTQMREPKDMRR